MELSLLSEFLQEKNDSSALEQKKVCRTHLFSVVSTDKDVNELERSTAGMEPKENRD